MLYGSEKNLNVLVAEDNTDDREYVASILEDGGHRVFFAENGMVAKNELETRGGEYDAVISDVHMPELDGLGLAEFNFRTSYIPFVVTTNSRDADSALEFIKFGVQDYVVKPVHGKQFISVLENSVLRKMSISSGSGGSHIEWDGNMALMEFPSTIKGVKDAGQWIGDRVMKLIPEKEIRIFSNNVYEFLINAHEHGNMKLSESQKGSLIDEGSYGEFLKSMEEAIDAKIRVEMSVIGSEVGISISDEGDGFDHELYTSMTKYDLIKRLGMPNGRGIVMAKTFFDSIKYSDHGSSVQLTRIF
jgi:CheY-like chemotaxis protein